MSGPLLRLMIEPMAVVLLVLPRETSHLSSPGLSSVFLMLATVPARIETSLMADWQVPQLDLTSSVHFPLTN